MKLKQPAILRSGLLSNHLKLLVDVGSTVRRREDSVYCVQGRRELLCLRL